MLFEKLRRQLVRISLSALILVAFLSHGTHYIRMDFIDRLEHRAYDARLVMTMPETVDDRIVIVDIDESSLAAEGRWPWPRSKLAHLMDQLFEHYNVDLVGFDVVFAEADESSGLGVLENLADTDFRENAAFRDKVQELRPSLDHDTLFAESFKDRRVILGYYFSDIGDTGTAPKAGVLPPPVFGPGQFTGRDIPFVRARGYGANLAPLQMNAVGAGHFNPAVDADGVIRRIPMLYEYEGAYYEALSLSVVRTALGVDRIEPGFPQAADSGQGYTLMEWLKVGDRTIPVDKHVQALVPYRGRQGSFPYVSATDVLHGVTKPEVLDGKLVLVGTSAPGLLDLRSTPMQKVYAGVEIHANVVAGILDKGLKAAPAYVIGAEVTMLVLVGLIMTLLLPLLSPLWSAAATLALLVAVLGIDQYLWRQAQLVFPIASTLLLIAVMFLFNMSYGFFVESRGKRQLAGLFGQYVPPELVEEMSDHPDSYSMEGESREMSVLFSDVRSFTTISEGLDPKELSRLMNSFLTPMTGIIHERRGTIDKYMGDAIMSFWGAPLPDPDHARNALEAGLAMITRLRELQPEFDKEGWPEIRIGVGVNTGAMNVGNMGSEFRMAYTVMGDAVNLGSRLEGLTKGYGVQMIVNETTREAVPDFAYRELDRVRVKGKDKPVTIYEPIGPAESVDKATRDELKIYEQALKLYRSQEWDMAEIQFLNLQQANPDRFLYNEYLQRIAVFRQEPPEKDWDGVFTHKTK